MASVEQKGTRIVVTGLKRKWEPTAAQLKALGCVGMALVLPAGSPKGSGVLTLRFKRRQAAEAAFGALFVEGATGLGDLMPDDTQWHAEEIKRAERQMKRSR